ncbi:IS66 family insertion sequence element accessory protein TnpB [Roseomonas sp. HF4]|uniref:IS66 family insertion sequence element accessory protein TnpB n=1 Tax=Roseomonas sp. HF4 TaxID=2562313 RepID=UPI0010C07C99|nr:IS66 family insertion sequence element accessory protein TnpB [Roseomonas sp. HF4]
MIGPAPGTRIFLACGQTDMRRGMDGLAALVQHAFGADPFVGAVWIFRGRRGRLVKCLWYDGQGLCLFAKRLERGHFPWPVTNTGSIALSAAQASMLLEGIDWRNPQRTWRPSAT